MTDQVIYKFVTLEFAEEANLRFIILEDNGDRAKYGLVDAAALGFPLGLVSVYRKSDMEIA